MADKDHPPSLEDYLEGAGALPIGELFPGVKMFTLGPMSDEGVKHITGDNALKVKLAAGNPGAATVLAQLTDDEVRDVEALGLSGPRIWIAYKDYCGEDIEVFKHRIYEDEGRALANVKRVYRSR